MSLLQLPTIAHLELHQANHQQGLNSSTFLGRDPNLDALVFVKQIPKKVLDCANYFKEAQILYESRHPNVMEIRFASEDSDHVYFVMDVCSDGSLSTVCQNKFLTPREVVKYSLEFLSGLHFIHTKGIIHFDVKPSNILVGANGGALLSDFGLAKHSNSCGFAQPDMMYNAHMPPEHMLAQDLTVLADIYQAGVTMYRLCNGETHYMQQLCMHSDLDKAIVSGLFPDRRAYAPHIPKPLSKIINKAMNVNPSNRHQSVLDIQNLLSKIEDMPQLDWRFEMPAAGYHRWTRQKYNQILCFETLNNGITFSASCYKINMQTQVSRYVRNACRSNLPISSWNQFCHEKLQIVS